MGICNVHVLYAIQINKLYPLHEMHQLLDQEEFELNIIHTIYLCEFKENCCVINSIQLICSIYIYNCPFSAGPGQRRHHPNRLSLLLLVMQYCHKEPAIWVSGV